MAATAKASPAKAKALPGKAGQTQKTADADADDQTRDLDTPRTRDACRRLGLTLSDLRFRPFAEFYVPGDLVEKQQLRFEHHERKRRERLKMALQERANVMMNETKGKEPPGVQSGHFLGMMEMILDKESKRLESDLKGQLRYHCAMEKDNQKQLEREEKVVQEEKRRDNQRGQRGKKLDEVSSTVRNKAREKKQRNDELIAKQTKEYEDMKQEYTVKVDREAHRVEEFLKLKAQRSISQAWHNKVAYMKTKVENMRKERIEQAELALKEIDKKIETVDKSREAQGRALQIRSEERHLHVLDVRAEKAMIDRRENFAKEKMREEMDQNTERIETLLALKDNILEQRKARTSKMEATAGARALNLRRDCPVGPGRYEVHRDRCLNELPCTLIKQSNISHEQFVESQTKPTAKNPAPGTYDVKVLPDGQRVDRSTNVLVRFPKTKIKTYLDQAIQEKSENPAPGRYDVKMVEGRPPGTKFRRESIDDTGLDAYSPKNYPVWARLCVDSPGPQAYNVDTYMRKEVLRRAQRSLPNLTRAMLTGPPEEKKKK